MEDEDRRPLAASSLLPPEYQSNMHEMTQEEVDLEEEERQYDIDIVAKQLENNELIAGWRATREKRQKRDAPRHARNRALIAKVTKRKLELQEEHTAQTQRDTRVRARGVAKQSRAPVFEGSDESSDDSGEDWTPPGAAVVLESSDDSAEDHDEEVAPTEHCGMHAHVDFRVALANDMARLATDLHVCLEAGKGLGLTGFLFFEGEAYAYELVTSFVTRAKGLGFRVLGFRV